MPNICDQIRKIIEKGPTIRNIILFRSLGGGTGSGLSSAILDALSDHAKLSKIEVPIYPSPQLSSSIVEPYNAILSEHFCMEEIELGLLFDNDAMYKICENKLKIEKPTFNTINQIVSQTISCITANLRFQSILKCDLNVIQTNLVPYPRIHFPVANIAPVLPFYSKSYCCLSVNDLTKLAFDPSNNLISSDLLSGKFLACSLFYRGEINSSEIYQSLNNIKAEKQIVFVDWCPSGFKISVSHRPQLSLPTSAIASTKMSLAMLSHNSSISQTWTSLNTKFHQLYRKKCFLHWFICEGLEEDEFIEAAMNITSLIDDYEEVSKDNVGVLENLSRQSSSVSFNGTSSKYSITNEKTQTKTKPFRQSFDRNVEDFLDVDTNLKELDDLFDNDVNYVEDCVEITLDNSSTEVNFIECNKTLSLNSSEKYTSNECQKILSSHLPDDSSVRECHKVPSLKFSQDHSQTDFPKVLLSLSSDEYAPNDCQKILLSNSTEDNVIRDCQSMRLSNSSEEYFLNDYQQIPTSYSSDKDEVKDKQKIRVSNHSEDSAVRVCQKTPLTHSLEKGSGRDCKERPVSNLLENDAARDGQKICSTNSSEDTVVRDCEKISLSNSLEDDAARDGQKTVSSTNSSEGTVARDCEKIPLSNSLEDNAARDIQKICISNSSDESSVVICQKIPMSFTSDESSVRDCQKLHMSNSSEGSAVRDCENIPLSYSSEDTSVRGVQNIRFSNSSGEFDPNDDQKRYVSNSLDKYVPKDCEKILLSSSSDEKVSKDCQKIPLSYISEVRDVRDCQNIRVSTISSEESSANTDQKIPLSNISEENNLLDLEKTTLLRTSEDGAMRDRQKALKSNSSEETDPKDFQKIFLSYSSNENASKDCQEVLLSNFSKDLSVKDFQSTRVLKSSMEYDSNDCQKMPSLSSTAKEGQKKFISNSLKEYSPNDCQQLFLSKLSDEIDLKDCQEILEFHSFKETRLNLLEENVQKDFHKLTLSNSSMENACKDCQKINVTSLSEENTSKDCQEIILPYYHEENDPNDCHRMLLSETSESESTVSPRKDNPSYDSQIIYLPLKKILQTRTIRNKSENNHLKEKTSSDQISDNNLRSLISGCLEYEMKTSSDQTEHPVVRTEVTQRRLTETVLSDEKRDGQTSLCNLIKVRHELPNRQDMNGVLKRTSTNSKTPVENTNLGAMLNNNKTMHKSQGNVFHSFRTIDSNKRNPKITNVRHSNISRSLIAPFNADHPKLSKIDSRITNIIHHSKSSFSIFLSKPTIKESSPSPNKNNSHHSHFRTKKSAI